LAYPPYLAAMSVIIKNLTKRYGAQIAVNNISLMAGKGEILGFLGPNGAGKSTTMKMVTGYLSPDSGTAEVCGINVVTNPIEVKKKIGYLPESNPLYMDLYVKEYLEFMVGIHSTNSNIEIPKYKKETSNSKTVSPNADSQIINPKAQIQHCIEITGLGPEQHKKIGQLSKGYKQRVGIAAAIIHNPEVLILDEPTGGLDPNQLVEIRELIKALGKEKTVILSTHIMQEVEAMCDKVIIINKGTIVANDTLQNLKTKGGQKSLIVGFEEALEPEWLRRIEGVDYLEKLPNGQWKIRGKDIEAIRKKMIVFAAEENLNIMSLQTGGGSLEEIFRGLTQ
jgi:ABC-2 type transport system ATP-binding protein